MRPSADSQGGVETFERRKQLSIKEDLVRWIQGLSAAYQKKLTGPRTGRWLDVEQNSALVQRQGHCIRPSDSCDGIRGLHVLLCPRPEKVYRIGHQRGSIRDLHLAYVQRRIKEDVELVRCAVGTGKLRAELAVSVHSPQLADDGLNRGGG